MKSRLLILILTLAVFNCTYYHKAFKKDSQFFEEKEKKLLAETTGALTFGYGYDTVEELDYVFVYPYTKQDFKKKVGAMYEVLKKHDNDEIVSFYEKIFYLKSITYEQMLVSEKNKKWKSYTYIKQYLLPPIEEYTGLLEEGVLSVNPSYKGTVEERKVALVNEAQKEVAYIEQLRIQRKNRQVLNGRAPK